MTSDRRHFRLAVAVALAGLLWACSESSNNSAATATGTSSQTAADAGARAADASATNDTQPSQAGSGGGVAAGAVDASAGKPQPAATADAGAGAGAGAGGASGATLPAAGSDTCTSLPPVSDYAAPGPFSDAKMLSNVGPNNNYTLFRPDASLGRNGFRHPIVTWGNGISTTPDQYKATLTLIATHGFVIIACNDTQAERACLSDGLDWLIEQNTSGTLQGKLDVTRELTVGYSWGGGAAIDTANRPNVRATVSLHGMPPRETDAFAQMHAPLLLFTSTGDSFVTADKYVTPNYQASTVQTFYATLGDSTAGHLYVVDEGAVSCAVSGVLGTCHGALLERAPTIAWLRLWACDDQNAKKLFYGDSCTLCTNPWVMPQRKLWP